MPSFRMVILRASAWFCFVGLAFTSALAAAPPTDAELVQRGEYLSKLGDCGACHTSEGGKPLAGGVEFNIPTGIIYSTNITPDSKTGIGSYTLAQFEAALRRGIAADGRRLYPAMPYPSFSKISDEDVQAIYAYMMKGVAAADVPNKQGVLRGPFGWHRWSDFWDMVFRWGVALWNMIFLDDHRFIADAAKDPSWNRGAYIVEGLGHCGTCHTPRGLAMQEKALGDDGKLFLLGSTLNAWRATNLRDLWAEPEIVEFLKTGGNRHATAYGVMTEVVQNSTQYFTDDDLQAVAHYLKALSGGASVPAVASEAVATAAHEPAEGLYSTRGGLGYVQFCASCHLRDGEGVAGIFPPLAQNKSVLSDDPTSVVHIALTGWTEAEAKHRTHVFSMPGYGSLSDEELAEIVSFVRTSWGNHGGSVNPERVQAMRTELGLARAQNATPRLSTLLSSNNADELILGLRLMIETRDLLPGNVGNALDCSSCHIGGGTIAKASPFVGLTAIFPAYLPRPGRVASIEDRLNGCFLRSMNGAPLANDSREMRAMVAYMDWMRGDAKSNDKIEGRGYAKVAQTVKPDRARGETLFKSNCAICHGESGDGLKSAEDGWIFPPLWGDASFNIGAGIARTYTAAGFVNSVMPIGHGRNFSQGQGGLSEQDAVDIAEYFTHQPRPDYPDKIKDWPKGGRPPDSRY